MTDLRVSDHAVLRYLERVGGFEIERLRAEIAHCVQAHRPPGGTYVPIGQVEFVVREAPDGPVVSTVLNILAPQKPKRRKECHDDIEI